MKACFLCGKVHPISRRQAFRLQAATPGKLRRLLRGLGARHLRRRPALRKWSIHEIAVHLYDVEVAYGFRYRVMLGEPGSRVVSFDQDRWASGLAYGRQDLRAALDAFSSLRKAHLKLLQGLPAKRWRSWARHPEYKQPYRLEPVFIHLAAHDLNHLGQIQALRRRWRAA